MEIKYFQEIAGIIASLIFASSHIPMLAKVVKTKDLKSYSISNIFLLNIGNWIYWIYVLSLPFGAIWFLHGFYTIVMVLMLSLYIYYELNYDDIIKGNEGLGKRE